MRNHLHGDRDEVRGAQSLEQDVGYRLEDGVRHEEDGQGGIVAGRREAEVRAQAGELCVADVGAVQEGEQVEEAELVAGWTGSGSVRLAADGGEGASQRTQGISMKSSLRMSLRSWGRGAWCQWLGPLEVTGGGITYDFFLFLETEVCVGVREEVALVVAVVGIARVLLLVRHLDH